MSDATGITYNPAVPTKWTEQAIGYTVAGALDEVGARFGGVAAAGTDNHIVRWNGTDGLQDSPLSLNDSGEIQQATAGNAIIITGGDETTGIGGNAYLQGGDSDSNTGGTPVVQGGSSVTGTGGLVTIRGGTTTDGTGGTVDIDGGASTNSTNGQVHIGDTNASQIDIGNGTVPINITGAQTWAGSNVNAGGLAITNVGNVDGRDVSADGAIVDTAILDGDFGSSGLMTRTGAGVYASRTITAGTAISISQGSGQAGNPTISAKSGATTLALGGTPTTAAVGHVWKITLDESDFTGGSNQETVTGFVLPAGTMIEYVSGHITEQPVQGGMATCVLEIGTAGTTNKYTNGTTFNWNRAAGNFSIYGPVADNLESYTGTTNIVVKLTVTGLGATTGGLTAGTVDIYVKLTKAM